MIIYLVILIVTLLVIDYANKFFHFRKRNLKSPTLLPFFGHLLNKGISPLKISLYRRSKFGKIYGLWIRGIPCIIVSDPDIVKAVTQSEAHNFTATQAEEVDMKYLKDSFMAKKGQRWKDGRALMSPVFTTKRIKDIFPQIKKATLPLCKNIETLIKEGKQDEIEIKGLLKGYSLDVIAKFVFALELNSARDKDHPFVQSVRKFTEFASTWKLIFLGILPKKLLKILNIQFFDMDALEYVANLVKRLIKERNENTEENYNDFLDMLLTSIRKKNLEVKDDEIISMVIIFFLAGMETVSITISNLLYCLAINPKCQTELYNELIANFPNKEVDCIDDLHKCSYLEAVLKESQRMYPALTILFRVAEEPIKIKGLEIEKNRAIGIDVFSLQNSPDYWTEPEKFNPNRFLDKSTCFNFDNIVDSENMLFLPFGAGIRSCLATRYAVTQVKYAVAKLILNYEVYRTEKSPAVKYYPLPQQLFYREMFIGFKKRDN